MERKQYIEPAIAVVTSPELMQTYIPIASPNPGAGADPGGAEGKAIDDIVEEDEEDEKYPKKNNVWKDSIPQY
jgi:hypothetical protein